MDKAIMFGALAFAATLLIAGGSIYAEGTGEAQDSAFECPMHDAMEKNGLNSTDMDEMHEAMHGNGTRCQMMGAAGKNFTGNFTDMDEMHEAMHGNGTICPMMQNNGGMTGGNGMMGMMQRSR